MVMKKYRLLNEGEKIKRGDKIYEDGKWKTAGIYRNTPNLVDNKTLYKRKMKKKRSKPCKGLVLLVDYIAALEKEKEKYPLLSEGYRLLKGGETIKEGDEYLYGKWHKSNRVGTKIPAKDGVYSPFAFRRKCKFIDNN